MEGVSTLCDVWSLACTIFELLTGAPPYNSLPPVSAIYKIVMDDHPPLPDDITSVRPWDFSLGSCGWSPALAFDTWGLRPAVSQPCANLRFCETSYCSAGSLSRCESAPSSCWSTPGSTAVRLSPSLVTSLYLNQTNLLWFSRMSSPLLPAV